jgi:hypothetical protein
VTLPATRDEARVQLRTTACGRSGAGGVRQPAGAASADDEQRSQRPRALQTSTD